MHIRLSISAVLLLTSLIWLPLYALDVQSSAIEVSSNLLKGIEINQPVVLDIRCGEWTTALEEAIQQQLLSRNADVRLFDNDAALAPADSADNVEAGSEADILNSLQLSAAQILQVTLEQSTQTQEKRNIFSYTRYRVPVYHFVLKQVAIPGQRLISMREYSVQGEPEAQIQGSTLALKWYEPVVASALLGSLIIMLWTLQ